MYIPPAQKARGRAQLRPLPLAVAATLLLTIARLSAPPLPAPPRLLPDRSFVALSVDDFGRWADSIPLFPDADFIRDHPALHIANPAFWYARATVETARDLGSLLDFFRRLNAHVPYEQRAVLTPHFVVGGPHFDAMRRAGCGVPARPAAAPGPNRTANLSRFDPRNPSNASADPADLSFHNCVYHENLITDPGPTGLAQHPYHRGDLKPAYRALFLSRVWHPEYHGRSHFGVSKWLSLLRTDRKAQACFAHNLVCASDSSQLRSEFNSFPSKAALKAWLTDGVRAFSDFWGYRPSLISSPHNTWNHWLAEVVRDLSFVGAELAEDQASYAARAESLSLHDRFRFDVFFPGFSCDTAVAEVERLLTTPERPRSRGAALSAALDPFRSAAATAPSPGVHERFVSLMWHAQNAMSSTYSPNELAEYMGCLDRVVRHVREAVPRAVFVTGAELHQIRSRGWSVETWDDGITLRNYATMPVQIHVPDLNEIYSGRQPRPGDSLFVKQISGPGLDDAAASKLDKVETFIGSILRLESDSVYQVTTR